MKKLYLLLALLILITGCGGKSDKNETKACSLILSGSSAEFTFDAINDKTNIANIDLTFPSSSFGTYDLANLTSEQKKVITESITSSLGIENINGIKIDSDFNEENILIHIKINIEDSEIDSLTILGLNKLKSGTLTEQIEYIKSIGGSCD